MSKETMIVKSLLSGIDGGILKKGDKIPSEYELAERFHVNKTTANKAVAKLVERGFVQRLRGKRGTVVIKDDMFPSGVVCYCLDLLSAHTFSSKLLKGAGCAARKRGYALQYINISPENLDMSWDDALACGANGVLCTGSNLAPNDYALPVVHVSNVPSGSKKTSYVLCDEYAGGRAMAEFILMRGHRAPVLLMEAFDGFHIKQRIKGYLDTFAESRVSDIRERIIHINSKTTFNPAHIHLEIQERFPDCSVLICGSDFIGVRMIDYFEGIGWPTPERISVASYGHMAEYQSLRAISTVDQHPEELGFQACEILIDIIEGKCQKPVCKIVQPSLLKGDTVALL